MAKWAELFIDGGGKMKIDTFSHIMTEKYLSLYREKVPAIDNEIEVYTRPVVDLGMRLRLMDRFPDVLQILTVAKVPLEKFVGPKDAVELARIANDELAELLVKYPNKFFGAAACLPMNDVDAALEEADRALGKLGLQGVQIYSRVAGEPLDSPKFKPLYKKMAEYNLPIWLHPEINPALDMDRGLYSWPYETTAAMFRLVQSGLFYECPDLKFIVHHAGAMVPFFADRLKWFASATKLFPQSDPYIYEHFRKFYVDTALYGNTSALQCAFDYYGAGHMLFGTDAPLGPRWGMIEGTIQSIERMSISEEEKQKIFSKNAIEMFKMAL
jgi:predicted TIM-barrel fold metal-dependent hydrolase